MLFGGNWNADALLETRMNFELSKKPPFQDDGHGGSMDRRDWLFSYSARDRHLASKSTDCHISRTGIDWILKL